MCRSIKNSHLDVGNDGVKAGAIEYNEGFSSYLQNRDPMLDRSTPIQVGQLFKLDLP